MMTMHRRALKVPMVRMMRKLVMTTNPTRMMTPMTMRMPLRMKMRTMTRIDPVNG